ncbi:MAG: hypothetical protein A2033_06290 [Bacteroidetes bacterium GWA2_31_9]|nr:MAG: hypothetical protein A2033_06290 [Bacteroidetes bacterium GWA2_31_9]
MKKTSKFLVLFTLIVNIALSSIYSQINSADIIHISRINDNLSAPVKFAIDASDNIYVTDGVTKNIKKYDATGNYLESINVGISPLSIAINNSGEIFVGDGENGKIYKVESNGTYSEFYIGCSFPSSMTFSPEGNLYVVDGELKRVLVLDISANLIQTIGVGTLIFPSEVVYDSRNSRILVAEHGGVGTGFNPPCKIWKFNLAGVLQGSFASVGNGDGQFYRIQGMTIGKCGNLYVCDPFQGNITVFDKNNNFVTRFGQFGTQTGDLNVPMDILFDSQERAIITSMNNGALEIFNINDTLPTSNIINSDATICSGQFADIKIDFTGTAPWTFTYTIDGLNPVNVTTTDNPYILNVAEGGLYEIVAISDLNKAGTCFSGSAKITVNSTIPTTNISTGNTSICSGSSINIPVQLTGTSPWTLTYTKDGANPISITTANNPYIITTSEAGLFEITSISAGGCSGSVFVGNADISISALPTSSFTSNSVVSVCQGEFTVFPIEFTGIAPWTFTYTLNNQNPVSEISLANTYELTAFETGEYSIINISDANCSSSTLQSTKQLIVKELPTSIMTEVNTSICSGNVVEIPVEFTGNAPFTFVYSINDSIYLEVITSDYLYQLQVNEAGTYQITSLYGDGCVSSNNIGISNVILNPLPTSEFVDGNNQLQICEGEIANLPINFTGTAPWTFSYTVNNFNQIDITTSDNQYILNTAEAGVYEIQSVSDNNCSNLSTLGTPEVVVIPLPSASLINSSASYCVGSNVNIPVEFSGLAPWTFTYTIDGLNPNIITTSDNPYNLSVSSSGIYQINNISSNNCIGVNIAGSTLISESYYANPSFIYNTNGLEITFSNNSQNANTYLWNFGDGQSSADVNPIHLYQSPDIYTVMITASNGICADSTISQIINLLGVNINSKNSETSISVFPNPSNGDVTIAIIGNNQKNWTIEVTNSLGQIIQSGNYNRSIENIDLTNLSSGIYTIKIVADGISKTEKLVINKL